MTERRKDAAAMVALFACVLAADWSLLSKAYVFEGLARAMPIEVGRWRELTPGNYLLYGPLGWCFHRLFAAFDPGQLAVVSLQKMDGILGALGAVLHFSTLRRLGASRAAAAAWSAALAACFGWWLWSTDAQNYILSALLLALAFRLAVERLAGGRVPPWQLGLVHALALTGHIVNGLFAAPLALTLLLTEPKGARARALAQYAAAFAAAGAAAYALALAVFVRPSSAAHAARWFAGSASAGPDAVAWHGALTLTGLGFWLRATLDVFTTTGPARLIVLGAGVAALARLRGASGLRRRAALVCAAWLGAYALVFTSWEPWTMVYRVPDLVPLTLLLWLGLSSAAAGWALAGMLAAANFFGEIRPRSLAENNPALQRMLFVKAVTAPGDLVTGDGGVDELYLPYFAERAPLVMGRYVGRPDALARRLDAVLKRGGGVVVTSRTLADAGWAAFFKTRRLERLAEKDGFALYRLSARP